MRARRQWVGFRLFPREGKPDKIPVIATTPNKNASATGPATWRSFDETLSGLADGAFSAVGYALAGDIVGIDLDGSRWMTPEGKLTEESSSYVRNARSYAERSIGGVGLHFLVNGKLAGRGRENADAGVEVYTRDRFFIVTGFHLEPAPHFLKDDQDFINTVLADFFHHPQSAEKAENVETMTSAFSDISAPSALSTVSAYSDISADIDTIIRRTLPLKLGQRNECIFNLARGLKFNGGLIGSPMKNLKPLVRQWHTLALPVIGTKPFDDSWADFLRAWQKANIPLV
jgi:primase-polymerase (primpol)-like protein